MKEIVLSPPYVDPTCSHHPTRMHDLATIKVNNIPTESLSIDYEIIEGTAKKGIDFKTATRNFHFYS